MRLTVPLFLLLLFACGPLPLVEEKEPEPEVETLVEALMKGYRDQARAFLDQGVDVNVPNTFGDTPLIWAVTYNDPDLLRELLEKGADVHHKGSRNRTALHWAARSKDTTLMILLLDAGAKVQAIDDRFQTPLMKAAAVNNFPGVRELLGAGAKANRKDVNGETAMHIAVRENASAVIDMLVATGASVEILSKEGYSPMSLALKLDRKSLFLTKTVKSHYTNIENQLRDQYQTITNHDAKPALDIEQMARRIHLLVNRERKKEGLAPLDYDPHLAQIATDHSRDMSQRGFFAHVNPDGATPKDRAMSADYQVAQAFGDRYKSGIGENIFQTHTYVSASTSFSGNIRRTDYVWQTLETIASSCVQGWMDSPGHRANILGKFYVKEGLGIYIDEKERIYITQNLW